LTSKTIKSIFALEDTVNWSPFVWTTNLCHPTSRLSNETLKLKTSVASSSAERDAEQANNIIAPHRATARCRFKNFSTNVIVKPLN
jgi:hypothetical protein